MKKKSRFWTYPFVFLGLSVILIYGCKEDDEIIEDPGTEMGIVTDVDGNTYTTVIIGSQTWMAENLKTTKFNDHSAIPEVIEDMLWTELTTPAFCWYDNDITHKTTYGALYNWYAVNTGKLAPVGWHVPTQAEWTQLINYLGGEEVAGAKLKEMGLEHWPSPNADATNEVDFTALPAGYRYYDTGIFIDLGYRAHWWSATEDEDWPNTAWSEDIIQSSNSIGSANGYKQDGFSIRCIKD